MPAKVAGATVEKDSTWNCSPNLGWTVHLPARRRVSPGCTPAKLPTAVTSCPESASATTTTLHASSSFANRTRSSVPSRVTASEAGKREGGDFGPGPGRRWRSMGRCYRAG